MSLETGGSNKGLQWARKEYQQDKDYWKDRSQNGNGLIKEIADFVIKQGAGHE